MSNAARRDAAPAECIDLLHSLHECPSRAGHDCLTNGRYRMISVSDADDALSFLPLCHALERQDVYLYLYKGLTVTFAESLETVARDMVRVAPTVMTGVPRVFEKLHARILGAVSQAPPVVPMGARCRPPAHQG